MMRLTRLAMLAALPLAAIACSDEPEATEESGAEAETAVSKPSAPPPASVEWGDDEGFADDQLPDEEYEDLAEQEMPIAGDEEFGGSEDGGPAEDQ
ncbi:hypothetical protein [Erythrobacter sp. JK5]|uniref:hypothetical protein n=1 Tax=Erythrobacter sp. JK5 TaxID=2829500 RepID=UPI001BAAE149|nr:hypothetical protein [Erythrobacter sp. JK5]QUL38624.1 hypothetical protein KDC96_04340 [Erythrobacter sp. JK5]